VTQETEKPESKKLSEAEWEMVEKNMGLVYKLAGRYRASSMFYEDLVHEGVFGLMRAAQRYDSKKAAFATYAWWWIRQAITRALADQGRTIRIPVHMVETINKYQQVVRRLVQDLGRDPMPEETAAEMGVEVEKIRHIMKISQETISLEAPVGDNDDGDSALESFIPDEDSISPATSAARKILKTYINEIIFDLTSREQKILDMRFGLTDGVTHTLEEVGKAFGVTRERIRQIEAKAIRKLKHPSRSKKLKDYLE